MKCLVCKVDETRAGKLTIRLDDDDKIDFVVEDLDAEICENCGDYYLKTEAVMAILVKFKEAKGGAE